MEKNEIKYLSHTIKKIPNRLKVKYEWETIRQYMKVPLWLSREEIFESINNEFNNIKVGNKKTDVHFIIFKYLHIISLFKNQTKILIMSASLAIAICWTKYKNKHMEWRITEVFSWNNNRMLCCSYLGSRDFICYKLLRNKRAAFFFLLQMQGR